MEDIFESIYIHQEEEFTHKVTEQDLNTFRDLTGDDNPLHMDSNYAKGTSFKERVVHGMLGASFISTMIGTRLPGKGSLWYEQHLKFLLPVRIGDVIKIYAKVLHKSESQRIVVLETIVYNQSGKKVIVGEAKVKVIKKENINEQMEETKIIENAKGAVIISGASGGIGSSTAVKLARNGYAIVVNYSRNEQAAEKIVKQILDLGGRAIKIKADITSYEEVESMVSLTQNKFDKIEGLVNNASAPINYKAFNEIKWEDFQKHIDVQIKGAFNLCKLTVPHFIQNKKGSIINVSSIYADNVPPVKMMDYSLSKSALISLTKSLAVELGPNGVRVNCVSPGMTNTDMIADIPEKAKMISKMTTPLRKLAQPQDIANTIAFLISDQAGHITGETLRVCGGQVML